jgi:hypothetical protein
MAKVKKFDPSVLVTLEPKVIWKELQAIKADSRYQAEPASVLINAPLALIQVEMKAQVRALEWVLQLVATPGSSRVGK